MELTVEEEEMLDGKHGNALQKAMELLVAVGECYGAECMVPVVSAHLVAANPVNAGRGGTEFISEMAREGGRFIVPITTNPASLEPFCWRKMGFPTTLNKEHLAFSDVLARMGAFLSGTCTPYLIGHAPRFREHIAWGESSAILYANAVLGARTNREGGPTAIAAALTGRTPAYGYHLEENRHGVLRFVLNTSLKGQTDYATLGYFVGKIAQEKVPIITGIPPVVSKDELKCLGAAMSVSGSVANYHVVGVTPEAATEIFASGGKKISSSDTYIFGAKELKYTEGLLCQADPSDVNLVVLGCPHASIEQVREYAKTFAGKTIKSTVEVWILISNPLKRYAFDLGYGSVLETAGVKLVSNTCPAAITREYFQDRGFTAIATDSPKMVYYVSTTKNIPCYYASSTKLIDIITHKRKK